MKKTLLLVLIISIYIYSCSNNSVSPSSSSSTLTSLSGSIASWSLGSMFVYVTIEDNSNNTIYLDTGTINSEGAFSVKLTSPPASALLNAFSTVQMCTDSLQVTGTNLKYNTASLRVVDNSNVIKGNIFLRNYSPIPVNNSFDVYFWYFNGTGSIKGNIICNGGTDPVSYNISTTAGWQKVVDLFSYNQSGVLTGTSISNNEPSGAYWVFESSTDLKHGR